MTFGDTADEATAGRMVEEALAAGITTIDTANAGVGPPRRCLPGSSRTAGRTLSWLPRRACRTPTTASTRSHRRAAPQRRGQPAPPGSGQHRPVLPAPAGPCNAPSATPWPPWRNSPPKARSAPWACPTSPPGRSPTSSTQPAKWGRRGRWWRNSSTTSWPAAWRRSTEFAATHGVHTMVYNPLGGGLLTGQAQLRVQAV